MREYGRRWQENNVEKMTGYRRKWATGVSQEEYSAALEVTPACPICKKKFKETPHADHCHVTGKFRGLLCGSCNRALGLFKDDPKALKRAILYLEG